MKKLLVPGILAVFSLFLPSRSQANPGISPTFTYQTGVSSITTTIVTVSNSVGTQMDNPQMFGRADIEVQNIDATANLYCVTTSSNTPTLLATSNGRKISAGSSWILGLADTLFYTTYSTSTNVSTTNKVIAYVWCISDGGGSTKAAVTQIY